MTKENTNKKSSDKPIIELKNVTQKYPNGNKALKNVTLSVYPGEFVFVVGPSGAGKTTFMKTLMREVRILSGELHVCGFDLKRMPGFRTPHLRRKLGIVFQDYRLLPNMNAFDNVALALHVVGERKSQIKKKVNGMLKLVNLEDKANCFPDNLSGGEQQRLAFARAIVNSPKVIIADEPTGNVDPQLTVVLMELLQKINKLGTTIIMITHEKSVVDGYHKRVITFNNGTIVRDTEGGMFDEN